MDAVEDNQYAIEPYKRRAPRWGWIVPALAMLVLALAVGVFYNREWKDRNTLSDTPETVVGVGGGPQVTISPEQPIRDIGLLIRADATTVEERPVELQHVIVQRVVGDEGAWVGPSLSDSILVIHSGSLKNLTVGQPITVKGTVKRMPSFTDATGSAALDEAQRKDLELQTVYIKAD